MTLWDLPFVALVIIVFVWFIVPLLTVWLKIIVTLSRPTKGR